MEFRIKVKKLQVGDAKLENAAVIIMDHPTVEALGKEVGGLEGIIGKRKNSFYEPGKRSGAWIKYRVNRGQELVIGGYVPGPNGLDSIIVGYYKGDDLVYVARVRNGFVPASRR